MFGSWLPAGVTLRSTMPEVAMQAMVVSPSEVIKTGRLEGTKRFAGRVVQIEVTDDFFGCYILCGSNRKDLIQVEAWKELARVARNMLKKDSLV